MPADASLLTDIPLFAELDDDERKLLADVVDVVTVKKNETLFRAGDPGHAMYCVVRGQVELYIRDTVGQKIVLTDARPGAVFGELALFDEGPRTASALATEDTELLELDRADILLLVKKKPEAALHMLAGVGAMTRKADMLLRTRVARNANEEIEAQADKGGVVLHVADAVAAFSGSISFLVLHVVIFTAWIVLNLGMFSFGDFDKYPFGLLTMAVSLEAIILSTLLLFSSNRQGEKDRIRADIEYDVNVKAELEIAHLHEKLDQMSEDVLARLARIERAAAMTKPVSEPQRA